MSSAAQLLKDKGLQKIWAATEAATKGGALPDGDYVGVVEDFEVGLSKAEKLQITWHLRVTDGDYEGRVQYKFSGLSTDKSISFLKRDLQALGMEVPGNIEQLPLVIQAAVGVPMRFTVRTNGEFVNIDFQERVGGSGTGAPTPEPAGEEDGLTAEDVRAMSSDEMVQAIADYELDIDPDQYDTWAEVAELIIKQLELE